MVTYAQALAHLASPQYFPLFTQLNRGIEKEGLRCSAQGVISQRKHPKGLGATLTHPYITTDYSEALLEFITPVFHSAHEAQAHLNIAHRFAYEQLEDELIWPSSMPAVLQGEMSVPIADYGRSNLGQLKHIYRHGLWHRYGRTMQTIAGIHYNFSVPEALWPVLQGLDNNQDVLQDYVSARYFALIRNFRRHSWLVLYLFGASPAVCASFLADKAHKLETLDNNSLYAPYATSLRMSDFGYQNNAQSSLTICYNQLSSYLNTLGEAVTVPVPEYQAIGIKDEQGHYKQLNANLLQIENEYYSDIRPKRVAQHHEKPLEALAKYGVQYIEVRNTDINPFMAEGIDVPQMAFMDTFLLWCLFNASPSIEGGECQTIRNNQKKTTMEGRRPGLMLERDGQDISLQQWGLEVLASMQELANLLDHASGTTFHTDALTQQRLKLLDSSLTPSAQVLRELTESGLDFAQFTLRQAQQHRKTLSEPLAPDVRKHWQQLAAQSLTEQQQLEDNDTQSFDDYLAAYLKR